MFSDEYCPISDSLTKYGMVHVLAVSSDFRRQGFGKKLLIHAIQELFNKHKLKYVVLGVKMDNKPARTLYESLGFKLVTPEISTGLRRAWVMPDKGVVSYGLVKEDFTPGCKE